MSKKQIKEELLELQDEVQRLKEQDEHHKRESKKRELQFLALIIIIILTFISTPIVRLIPTFEEVGFISVGMTVTVIVGFSMQSMFDKIKYQ